MCIPQAWAGREWGRQGAGSQAMGRGAREPVMRSRGGSGRLEPPLGGGGGKLGGPCWRVPASPQGHPGRGLECVCACMDGDLCPTGVVVVSGWWQRGGIP